MIVVVDGPEKAGKTTFIKALQAKSPWSTTVRKWGPVQSPREYLYALKFDAPRVDDLVIWDRSWASEAVYCNVLPRDGELKDDPWIGEWRYGRIVQTVGLRLMLVGPDNETLAKNRDSSDHPIDPIIERAAFFKYATTYGWVRRTNLHTDQYVDTLVHEVIVHLKSTLFSLHTWHHVPPTYVGSLLPKVMVVGEPKIASLPSKFDNWIPFSSRYTTEFGRHLGMRALSYGWGNMTVCPTELIKSVPEIIIACGVNVQKWLKSVRPAGKVINTLHPSYLYRYGEGLKKSETEIRKLTERIND